MSKKDLKKTEDVDSLEEPTKIHRPKEDASLDEFPEADQFTMDGKPTGAQAPAQNTEAWRPVYEMENASISSEDAPEKKHRGLKIGLIVAGCIVIAAAAGVAGGGYYILKDGGAFQEDIFFTNTYMNGIDCAGMTVSQVYDAITQDMGTYTLTITERGGSETITGAEIDLAERPDKAAIQGVLDSQNENKLSLIRQYFSKSETEIELIRSYDEEKASACIDALTCLDTSQMIAPVDAQLVNGDTDYYISESVLGTTLDPEQARTAIENALSGYEESVDLESLGLYSSPSVTEDDESLTSQLAQIQVYTSSSITYDFSDRTYVCDSSVIKDFLVQDETGTWVLDKDLVHAWVDTMADETDTYKKGHTFTTHDGNTVDLPNGNYGWALYRDTTTDDLMELLAASTVDKIEPNYYHYGASRATNDIGSSYVEVDITNQMVYLYVKGECILSTPCVTGLASSSERATPSWGVWALSYKKSPAVLGTYEVQGYESHVNFWMPFNGGVGLHDADGWRSSYGGSIYKTNGSHGCINLPYSAAKTIYENISAGWPIIVYGK